MENKNIYSEKENPLLCFCDLKKITIFALFLTKPHYNTFDSHEQS